LLISNLKMELIWLDRFKLLERDPHYYSDECISGIYYLLLRDIAPLPVRALRACELLEDVPRFIQQARANCLTGSAALNVRRLPARQQAGPPRLTPRRQSRGSRTPKPSSRKARPSWADRFQSWPRGSPLLRTRRRTRPVPSGPGSNSTCRD